MSFNEKLPEWGNPGTEPPANKKQAGFLPGEKPPADWFNWLFNRGYKVLEEIRNKVELIGNKGKPGGYASLDDSGKVPADQLPFNEELENTVAQHTEDINQLEERLDTEQRQDVVLNAGMQILNAQRRATFSLSGIKGRTLVNLLGRDGNCERVDAFSRWFNSNQEVDTTNKVFGSGSLKITVTTSVDKTGGIFKVMTPLIKSNSYYILKCYFKNINLPDSIKPEVLMKVTDSEGDRLVGNYSGNMNKNTFSMTYGKAYTKSNLTEFVVYARIPGGSAEVGNSFNIDGFSLYEISAAEYAALDSMTLEQVDAKYPYVDSVQPVRNPYAIRYGENLAPTLYEGYLDSAMKVLSGYSALVKATGSTVVQYRSKLIPAIPNTRYTIRAKITLNGLEKYDGVYVDVLGYDEAGLYVFDGIGTSINGSDAFITPPNIKTMEVRIVSPMDAALGDYVVEDIMLNIGPEAKPFKPREDSMLALQTDLYADPLTGANADEVFEKDGQYFKLSKWNKVVLDGSINWEIASFYSGFKGVRYAHNYSNYVQRQALGVKFDGKIIPDYQGVQAQDKQTIDGLHTYIWISNTDSGWGDRILAQNFDSVTANRVTYQLTIYGTMIGIRNVLINGVPYAYNWSVAGDTVTLEVAPPAGSHVTISYISAYIPTADEIKAYFMGWKMYPYGDAAGAGAAFNGTGTKGWCYRIDGVKGDTGGSLAGGTTTLPTTMAPNWTPYQLVYPIATPTVEPIVSEGMLTFNEGDNQIEIGTGMVVRESTKPYGNASTGNLKVINYKYNDGGVDTWLKNPLKSFVGIYRNGMIDLAWEIKQPGTTARGLNFAQIQPDRFDSSAAYSVTYLMLDTSPIVPFIGSYAANEKAMLQELTDAVQQNATAVSVLMNKKTDKDKPIVWIEPTLINGATVYPDTAFRRPSYSRTADGLVSMSGLIRITSSTGSAAFILPVGYRPSKMLIFSCTTGGGNVLEVRVTNTGALSPMAAVDWVSLEGIRFIAEQ